MNGGSNLIIALIIILVLVLLFYRAERYTSRCPNDATLRQIPAYPFDIGFVNRDIWEDLDGLYHTPLDDGVIRLNYIQNYTYEIHLPEGVKKYMMINDDILYLQFTERLDGTIHGTVYDKNRNQLQSISNYTMRFGPYGIRITNMVDTAELYAFKMVDDLLWYKATNDMARLDRYLKIRQKTMSSV